MDNEFKVGDEIWAYEVPERLDQYVIVGPLVITKVEKGYYEAKGKKLHCIPESHLAKDYEGAVVIAERHSERWRRNI